MEGCQGWNPSSVNYQLGYPEQSPSPSPILSLALSLCLCFFICEWSVSISTLLISQEPYEIQNQITNIYMMQMPGAVLSPLLIIFPTTL